MDGAVVGQVGPESAVETGLGGEAQLEDQGEQIDDRAGSERFGPETVDEDGKIDAEPGIDRARRPLAVGAQRQGRSGSASPRWWTTPTKP